MDTLPLATLGLLACVPIVALVLVVAWVAAWRRVLRRPDRFDAVEEIVTGDGATIVLGRYLPRAPVAAGPPVLLCHGLAMNRRALALDPERGFAWLLAAAGRDAWVLELRGVALGASRAGIDGTSFDTYAEADVPAAIAHVRTRTGAAAVDWVGFSMGGMLAYAHLGARGRGGIRRLVTIGSPVRFRAAARWIRFARVALALVEWGARTPFGFLATAVAPLMVPALPRALTFGLRGEHYDAPTLRAALATTLADVPRGVTAQFVRWVAQDGLTSNDGARDYLAGLGKVRAPVLVIAGSRDRIATPDAVREGYERLGAAEKRYVEIGLESGAHADYDHLDLILGRRAAEEVCPLVLQWLSRHDGGTDP